MRGVKGQYSMFYKITIIQTFKGLISFIAGFIMANFSSKLLNYALEGKSSILLETAIMFIIFVVIYECFNFITDICSKKLQGKSGHSFRLHIYDKFYNLEISYIQKINGGQVKEVLGDDLETIEKFIVGTFPNVINGTLVSVGYLAYICNKSFLCGIVIFIIGLIQIIPPIIVKKYLVQNYDETREIEGEISDFTISTYKGLSTIKSYNLLKWINDNLNKLYKNYFKVGRRLELTGAGEDAMEETVKSILQFGTYGFIGLCVLFNKVNMDNGLEIIVLSSSIYTALNNIFNGYKEFFIFNKAKERLGDIIKNCDKNEEDRVYDITPIKFNKVSFGYEERTILEDVDLAIYKGSKIAIIGENGGGKSTLFKLLLDFYKPTIGEINYGNYSSSKNNKKIHDSMCWLPQEDFHFLKSPKELFEILRGEKVLDLEEVIELSYNLGLTEELLNSERIGNLSGGERKKVYLAIALCKKGEVLFLDEPTNSLDIKCRETLIKYIKESNKTVVVISHDMEVIDSCTDIFEVRDKKIHHIKKGLTSEESINEDILLDNMKLAE